jgi:hypothetical protein|tara:strand:- start:267 stop:536 length:270 start_codon:yes stop_codon:yes gene_type:complete
LRKEILLIKSNQTHFKFAQVRQVRLAYGQMRCLVLILFAITLSGCKTLAPEGSEAAKVWGNWKNPDGCINQALGFSLEVLGNTADVWIK